jgi:hypothetical protein
LGEEFTAEAQRSWRDAESRWEVVNVTFNAVCETDGMEIDEKAQVIVGHY